MLSLLLFIFGKKLDPRLRYTLLIFGIGMAVWKISKVLKAREIAAKEALQIQFSTT